MGFIEDFNKYLPGKQRRELSIMYHARGGKLQAVKDLMGIKNDIPELRHCGLKECKEYVEALPVFKEDPVLDILDKIEQIERYILKDLPILIEEGMPNISKEQAEELVKLPDNFLSELKRRATVASTGNRFGI